MGTDRAAPVELPRARSHVDRPDCFNQFGGDDVRDIGRVSDIGDIVLASAGL
ncbi:hypothetical protein [Bradyrhizobium liaoningense]|uniref:hypothetical protein n=1 Tax=Bradyrhizobium liaoningense TaxID=43992 RepID=UPI001BAA1274|nr:hypothetical protein [Bradyrhizobium liaoningense]MBR0901369.1 hypothetical protein [Bradyrhizobium liaoningense]